jgi:hypothetical protein
VTGGKDPVELGSNNSGQGVGGSPVRYSMIATRLHAGRRRTLEGATRGAFGALRSAIRCSYNYYSGVGIVGETLPQLDNRVKLHDIERDRYGLPLAHAFRPS